MPRANMWVIPNRQDRTQYVGLTNQQQTFSHAELGTNLLVTDGLLSHICESTL